ESARVHVIAREAVAVQTIIAKDHGWTGRRDQERRDGVEGDSGRGTVDVDLDPERLRSVGADDAGNRLPATTTGRQRNSRRPERALTAPSARRGSLERPAHEGQPDLVVAQDVVGVVA